MVEITIRNSTSIITGLTSVQFKKLRQVLSYTDTQYKYGAYNNYRKYLISSRGEYPTGLHYLVMQFHVENCIPISIVDFRGSPISDRSLPSLMSPSSYPTPYAFQLEAVKSALTHNRGIISAVTGSGKSLIIGLLIDAFKVKTLVVVPSLELKRQLTESLKRWFGVNYSRLIDVQNIDSLDPRKKTDAEMVIVDELHHVAAKSYRKLNMKAWTGVYHRFGLTGTPFRSNADERLLFEAFLSKVIYTMDYFKAVEHDLIVPVEAYYIELPKVVVKGRTYAQVYTELVVNREDRNQAISQLLINLDNQDASTLCLVREKRHGEVLSQYSKTSFIHGEHLLRESYMDGFNNGTVSTLIATNGIAGEGVDTKPCEYVIIGGLGKSKTQLMQQIGRGIRKHGQKTSCKVILVKDPSHKFTKNHFNEQVKVLKEEYGVIPVRLDI